MQTNIMGTHIFSTATVNVKKVIFTSSDKAVNPTSTMGATKLLAGKLITSANFMSAANKRFW